MPKEATMTQQPETPSTGSNNLPFVVSALVGGLVALGTAALVLGSPILHALVPGQLVDPEGLGWGLEVLFCAPSGALVLSPVVAALLSSKTVQRRGTLEYALVGFLVGVVWTVAFAVVTLAAASE
jgi:hypothetical protein